SHMCEEQFGLLTSSKQASPPAIAATRNAATENHVGPIMLDLPNDATTQDGREKRDRRDSKFRIRSPEHLSLQFAPPVPRFSQVSPVPPFPLVSPGLSDMPVQDTTGHRYHALRQSC